MYAGHIGHMTIYFDTSNNYSLFHLLFSQKQLGAHEMIQLLLPTTDSII